MIVTRREPRTPWSTQDAARFGELLKDHPNEPRNWYVGRLPNESPEVAGTNTRTCGLFAGKRVHRSLLYRELYDLIELLPTSATVTLPAIATTGLKLRAVYR